MNKPLPLALKKYSNRQVEQLFSSLPERMVNWLKGIIDSAATNTHRLWEGRGYGDMLANLPTLKSFDLRFKSQNNISPGSIENIIRNRYSLEFQDFKLDKNQWEYLYDLQSAIEECADDFAKYHLERAKQITPQEFASKIKEFWQKDIEEYEEEHAEWESEYNRVEDSENNYDEDSAFENWLDARPTPGYGYDTNRDRFTSRNEYEPKHGNVQGEIEEVEKWISDNGGDDTWNVFEDEIGIVEIASPILTTKNMGFLKSLLGYLSNKSFDSGTGLHVHIGMPEMTDGFDLLAMAATVDEEAVLAVAGRTSSTMHYTKKKDTLFHELWGSLPEGIITDQKLRSMMDRNITRYYGVNTIKAFNKHGTVEMRYLSSQILDHKDGIEKLFRYINYFLMLPRLAQGRNQIRYDVPGEGSMIFSRRQGGQVEIKKFPLNSKKISAPMVGRPVSDLRQQPEQELDKKSQLMKKFGSRLQKQTTANPTQAPDWTHV